MESNVTTAPVYRGLGINKFPFAHVDESVSGVKYYGWPAAPSGVDAADAQWRIMKETTANGITKREFPNGSDAFEFAWAQRANYNYSR